LQDKNLLAKGGNAVLIFSLVLSFCIKTKERTIIKMKFRNELRMLIDKNKQENLIITS
jgi:hypothetical protein